MWEGQKKNSALYYGMIAPLLPMRFAGEVWYQGESNLKTPAMVAAYTCRFPAMIADYREKFQLPDLSFFYVELAAYSANYAEIRRAQKHALDLPNVGFATAIDLGWKGMSIHSPRKVEVGRRLALSAQAIHYQLPVTYEGPTMEEVTVAVNGSLVTAHVTFRSAENLHASGTADCQAVGSKRCCDESPFQVTYDSLVMRANYTLSSSGEAGVAVLTADLGVAVTSASAVYVSLEFEGFPQCALYNGEGGPEDHAGIAASPFSTLAEPSSASPARIAVAAVALSIGVGLLALLSFFCWRLRQKGRAAPADIEKAPLHGGQTTSPRPSLLRRLSAASAEKL